MHTAYPTCNTRYSNIFVTVFMKLLLLIETNTCILMVCFFGECITG